MPHLLRRQLTACSLTCAVQNLLSTAALMLTIVSCVPTSPVYAQSPPTDANSTCIIPSNFNNWFELGHPNLNSVVNPADSGRAETLCCLPTQLIKRSVWEIGRWLA
jgi:hypothetical protein